MFQGEMVYVAGEEHIKCVGPVTTPGYTALVTKKKKGLLSPPLVRKVVPEKMKVATTIEVNHFAIEFPANEANIVGNRVGIAFDTACRMHKDGIKNVRICDYVGNVRKITAADVKKRDKAVEKMSIHLGRIIKLDNKKEDAVIAKKAA